eukprot:CAMPEP_0114628306 /NCGR_PEP_ID=MMETSP0168-20121206/12751_1 /TAXON_ID=95228 ORGANISM="Vannella sp., Strain DIVA3 517/6/12" /NCGR_SAMPLE_ID=MMETSP0168 /ASSEMBLY_ACC=CAM_ASM_000044 /LENGTH=487 /DNA_ID=CAMNT_0001839681 /DNA_START=241 /DNA_END=1704 /DNA_ORIENTATION=-
MSEEEREYDYDLFVIGGGSGGISCARRAAQLGKKVGCADFVKPSPQGTQWGLGGTCVNVGCIPKKLMHHGATIGEHHQDAAHFGWKFGDGTKVHEWSTLVENVQNHIMSLNWGYRVELRTNKVEYHNALAKFLGPHKVSLTFRNKSVKEFTAEKIVIAVGGRPTILDIPGAEHAITSDDIFQLDHNPGKTLVVGASYVALECAGFLVGFGYDTTVMVRSILLRGFDQDIAERIGNYMEKHGTKLIRPATPKSIVKKDDGKLAVTFTHDGEEKTEEYDTVLFAAGRYADTKLLDLDVAGVEANPKNGKIPAKDEQTNVPHIYAIGDILDGKLELTPVAIKAGKLLAERLYSESTATMDYDNVPTTVFTPIEYGCCGLAEEEAEARHGKEQIETFLTHYKPTYWNVAEREDNTCFMKLICLKPDLKVIGYHVLGVQAGEITQGVAVAMKAGATKATFDDTVGIHPTSAEAMTTMKITRASGDDITQKGC